MTFWEKHRNAILTAGASVFLLAVGYLGYLRGSYQRSEELTGKISAGYKALEEFYPELAGAAGVHLALLADVRAQCSRRNAEYETQLKELTARLRFPFDETADSVPKGERLGIYVIRRVDIVEETVDKYRIGNVRGAHTQLAEGWLDFRPERYTPDVDAKEARESLRRLALAERITKLAIDQGVSWVLKVRPEKVHREAAYYWTKAGPGVAGAKAVRKPYANAFIVNYPVSITLIGSVDSVMKFFHSARGEKQFLVVQAFNILSPEPGGVAPGSYRDLLKPDEIVVTISAACMDFELAKPDQAGRLTPEATQSDYVVPRRPLGH